MAARSDFTPARERQVDAVLLEIDTAVAQRRRLARLTQQALADKAHVSRSTVTQCRTGTVRTVKDNCLRAVHNQHLSSNDDNREVVGRRHRERDAFPPSPDVH